LIHFREQEIQLEFPEFPTHVKLTERRRVKGKRGEKSVMINKPRFLKINGQGIYNRTFEKFAQAKMISFMKQWLKDSIERNPDYKKIPGILELNYPLSLSCEVHSPINYGNYKIKAEAEELLKPKSNSASKWDLLNFGWIWIKCFEDFLTENKFITDDSIEFLQSTGSLSWKNTPDINNRKLIFKLSWKEK